MLISLYTYNPSNNMKVVIQRISYANLSVEHKIIASIQQGIVVFIGFEKDDTSHIGEQLITKTINYRMFPDNSNKMHLSVKDINGGVLLVPQFTIVANTNKGLRANFCTTMPPHTSKILFNNLIIFSKSIYNNTKSGVFGANMQVEMCNDGPVTFILD